MTARNHDAGPVQPSSHRGALPYMNRAVCGKACGETPSVWQWRQCPERGGASAQGVQWDRKSFSLPVPSLLVAVNPRVHRPRVCAFIF